MSQLLAKFLSSTSLLHKPVWKSYLLRADFEITSFPQTLAARSDPNPTVYLKVISKQLCICTLSQLRHVVCSHSQTKPFFWGSTSIKAHHKESPEYTCQSWLGPSLPSDFPLMPPGYDQRSSRCILFFFNLLLFQPQASKEMKTSSNYGSPVTDVYGPHRLGRCLIVLVTICSHDFSFLLGLWVDSNPKSDDGVSYAVFRLHDAGRQLLLQALENFLVKVKHNLAVLFWSKIEESQGTLLARTYKSVVCCTPSTSS